MNSRRLTWSISSLFESLRVSSSLFESLRVGSSVASGRLGRHVYPQKGHEEDQDGIKRDFSDVGSRTPPLPYSLPNHGGSPWVANRTHGSAQKQPATEPTGWSLGQT